MTISSKEDLAGMKRVGKLVGETLREMSAAARPGMTTAELDAVGAGYLRRHGARSAPQMTYGFPGFNLISVNEEVVHGIPSRKRVLVEGDLVSLDFGVKYEGYYTDAAITVPVGEVDETHGRLKLTRASAVVQRPGPLRDLHAIAQRLGRTPLRWRQQGVHGDRHPRVRHPPPVPVHLEIAGERAGHVHLDAGASR